MSETDEPNVVGMISAGVTEEGGLAEITLKHSDGSIQVLRFSPTLFLTLVKKVFELVLPEKMRTAESAGHLEVAPFPVSKTSAQEAFGGNAIIIHLRLQNGILAAFALPPQEAAELHTQLGAAVENALRQQSQSRH